MLPGKSTSLHSKVLLVPPASSSASPKLGNHKFFHSADSRETKEYKVPRLPLLDEIVARVKSAELLPDLSNTYIIGVQHMLETTVTLIDSLHELGIPYGNICLSGKCYSNAPEVEILMKKRGVKLMPSSQPEYPGEYERYCRRGLAKQWEFFDKLIRNKEVDRIIVLDEGGRCLENMPRSIPLDHPMAAIEQTRAGLYNETVSSLLFPLIEVASTASKKYLEPPLIAGAIMKKVDILLSKLNPEEKTVFGVIGNGAIGNGVCRVLLSRGYQVLVYDENENAFARMAGKNFFRVESVEQVVTSAKYIFGCTGRDITEGSDLISKIKMDTTFISCSSEDKEFRTLLKEMAHLDSTPVDTTDDIHGLSKNKSKVVILKGGFPINFDRTPSSVPAADIEITRALLLVGCLQAITEATKPINDGVTLNRGSRRMVNPKLQSFCAMRWLPHQPEGRHLAEYINLFSDPVWVERNSGGRYYENPMLENCFKGVATATPAYALRSRL